RPLFGQNALTAGPLGREFVKPVASANPARERFAARDERRPMNAYWPILLMMLIGAAIAVVSMTLSKLVGQPATEGAQDKRDPYECGMESDGSTLLHVPVKF